MFKYLKKKIRIALVNKNRYPLILQEIPHRDYIFDVVITYLIPSEDKTAAPRVITNEDLKEWNITEEMLYNEAKDNIANWELPYIEPYYDLLERFFEGQEIHEELNIPVGVLENRDRLFAASGLLIDSVLEEFAEKLESDLYILPVSTHIVILNAVSNKYTDDATRKLFQDIKMMVGDSADLSETVWRYSREQKKIMALQP